MRKLDLVGVRFGRLVVVSLSDQKGGRNQRKWECICDCGNRKTVQGESLRDGSSKSCGCLRIDQKSNLSHGLSKSRIYRIYRHMVNRCSNSKVDSYPLYGGRGIVVCDEWKRFEPFYEWAMNNGYSEVLSIDRIDNEKGYSPDNCQWSSVVDQARNKRNTVGSEEIASKVRELRANGVRNKDVSDQLGLSRTTVSDITYHRSWSDGKTKKGSEKQIVFVEFDSKKQMAHVWEKDPRVKVCASTIIRRKRSGMSDFDCLFAPRKTRSNFYG